MKSISSASFELLPGPQKELSKQQRRKLETGSEKHQKNYVSNLQTRISPKPHQDRRFGQVSSPAHHLGQVGHARIARRTDERKQLAHTGRHPECAHQFRHRHAQRTLQRTFGQHQRLRRLQPLGHHRRHRHQGQVPGRQNQVRTHQLPCIQRHPPQSGHRHHPCRRPHRLRRPRVAACQAEHAALRRQR